MCCYLSVTCDRMKTKSIFLAVSFVLILLRILAEASLVEFGIENDSYNYLYKCTIIGCVLKLQYQLFIEPLSFISFWLLLRTFANQGPLWNLVFSVGFVVLFMITDLYEVLGEFPGLLIPFEKLNNLDGIIHWSITPVMGTCISVLISMLLIARIKKPTAAKNKQT